MFVKICGIRTEEDALYAVAMGADAVGFVFAPSKRQVTAAQARAIAERLPPDIVTVGVFRNAVPSRVIQLVHDAGLRAAQLHGEETPDDVIRVREQVPMVIKALTAGSSDVDRARQFRADAVLIDAATPGSGEIYDWSLAENAPQGVKVIMAGGLTPDNVADAIRKVRPWGVDVSTGVESAPGEKDPRLVRAFITNARKAADALASAAAQAAPGDEDTPYDWMEDS
ncbi:MAG: phosphoribosylanthranilate isomerase [Acidimicrobiales bacterium]|nr:phosphoribosylanthranilate isomerase [Acidimicrobiales bacterium]